MKSVPEDLPAVALDPGEDLDEALGRTVATFRSEGIDVEELYELNEFGPTRSYVRFLRASFADHEYVIVVTTAPWNEEVSQQTVQILIQFKLDLDGSGRRSRFRFVSAHPVPQVLELLFGDDLIFDFEFRAALAAQFGSSLTTSSPLRLAAVGANLLREIFHLQVRPGVREDLLRLDELFMESITHAPEGATLWNSVFVLGCFLGEQLAAWPGLSGDWSPGEGWPILWLQKKGSQRTIHVNPIRKVLERLQNGADQQDFADFADRACHLCSEQPPT